MLLEHYRKGIARTYLFELVDDSASPGDYGLIRRDGSLKPQFFAVKNLLNMLADPGPAMGIRPLPYSTSPDHRDLRTMCFQKRNGSYYLALWLEVEGWDVVGGHPIGVVPHNLTISLPKKERFKAIHSWTSTGAVMEEAYSGQSVTLSIGDQLTILEVV